MRKQVAEQMAKAAAAAEDAEETQQSAHALAEQQQQADQRNAELTQQATEIDHARAELETQRQRLDDRAAQLDEFTQALDHRTAELDEKSAQLDRDREALDATAQRLAEQTDAAGDQADIVADLQGQLDTLTHRIHELEPVEALLAEQTARAEQATEQADQLQARLDEAQQKLESLEAQAMAGDATLAASDGFDADETLAGTGVFSDADRDAYEAKLADLRDELAAARAAASMAEAGLDGNADDALQARAEQLDRRAAELDAKQKKYRDTLKQSKEMVAAEKQAVRQQQAEVEDAYAQVNEERERLRIKKQKLIRADEYIKSRRHKLTRYRKLLRKRSMALKNSQIQADSAGAQYQGLEKERQMLIEVKKFLENSEAEMASKYATGKAAGTVASLVIALAAVVAVSWFASFELARPVWHAAIGFEITQPVSPDAAPTDFATAYREVLLSEPVLTDTVHRLRREGITRFGDADSLRPSLAQDLTVAGQPPALNVTLATADPDAATSLLDALGRAFLGHQMATDREQGRADSTSIAIPAAVDAQPVENDQLQWFGILAGSAAGGMIVLYLLARVALARSRRVFDDSAPELDVLDKPANWSPATGEQQAA
jgi:hypothetical protein